MMTSDDEEWRSALDGVPETERVQACGHSIVDANGDCIYCGEAVC